LVGSLPSLWNRIGRLGAFEKAAEVTDTTVASLYLDRVLCSLDLAGIHAQPIIIEGCERIKTLSFYAAFLESMAIFQLNCRNLVILLGGGVVSDIVGFIAATYRRGIDY
jgi:3-dehydroquinate synthetase